MDRINGRDYPTPDIIINGGILVTMVEGSDPVRDARIFIREGRITDIQFSGPSGPTPCEVELIDAANCIIMPGLINAHSHTAMTIFRGLADDLPLEQWLFDKIFPAEAKYLNPETVYWGTLLGCLEMIASGTTSFIDGYFFQDETAKAVQKSGLRGLLAQGIIDFPAPGMSDPDKNLLVGREFIEKWIDCSELITPGLFCHSPLTCSDRTLKSAMAISSDFSVPLQIHLSETSEEVQRIINKTDLRPVHYLDKIGLINKNLIAVHASHLNDEEIELISQKDTKIVHVPESNMKLASGIPRVSEMLKKGIIVGLGTDGCASNNNLDMFQEMDSGAKAGKMLTLDPVDMDAGTVLKMATVGGAEVLGLGEKIGTIEVGKNADIIVVDLQSPHLVPFYNPLSSLVYSANGADVKDVIVNGKILMKDRSFKTLDPKEIIERVTALCKRIIP